MCGTECFPTAKTVTRHLLKETALDSVNENTESVWGTKEEEREYQTMLDDDGNESSKEIPSICDKTTSTR